MLYEVITVTACVTATKRVALPRVYSQLTCGILRRKIASHTPRQAKRSSNQSVSLAIISTSLHEKDTVFNFALKSIKIV